MRAFPKLRSVIVAIVCLAAFLLFAEWYLPRHGYMRNMRPWIPWERWTISQIRKTERRDLARILENNGEPYKGFVWQNGMRASRPLVLKPRSKRVLVLGCSCTWGLGVNDSDTFVWHLNQKFEDVYFDNAGFIDFGPSRCQMTLNDYCLEKPYDVVLYCAIDHHKYRDTHYYFDCADLNRFPAVSDEYRTITFIRPYSDLRYEGKTPFLVQHEMEFISWPGDGRLYLMNFAKLFFYRLKNVESRREWLKKELSPDPNVNAELLVHLRLTLDAMYTQAKAYGAEFGFVSLDGVVNNFRFWDLLSENSNYGCDFTPRFPVLEATYPQDFHTTEGLHTVKTKCDNGDHPVPLLHKFYADKIEAWLRENTQCRSWDLR